MMDDLTLDMLRTSLRHVLTDGAPGTFGDRLDELGWSDVVADDETTALRTLFTLKGETLSPVDALGPRLAETLAASTGDPRLATAVVGLASPFGTSTWDDSAGQLAVDAMALSTPPAGATFVVAVEGPGEPRLAIVPAGANIASAAFAGTDETLGAHRLTGAVDGDAVEWIDGAAAADAWQAVVARGRWLLACELVGIAHHVIASAVEYTGQRVQYGRAIGSFQALQHRIASAHALVIGAEHLVAEAAAAGDEWSALVAKAMAGQAAEGACTQAQQCYGAIGYTWEHEFHRYLRRTYVLDRLLGDWRSLEHEIGIRLQATGVVPLIGTL